MTAKGLKYVLSENLKEVIPQVDAIYSTRLQDEYDTSQESTSIDYTRFCFEEEHLALLRKNSVILHPFPRRDEISVKVDKDSRALYWKQARNGMWVRMALILKLFSRDHEAFNFA